MGTNEQYTTSINSNKYKYEGFTNSDFNSIVTELSRQNEQLLTLLDKMVGLIENLKYNGVKIYDEEINWIKEAKQIIQNQNPTQ